MTKEWEREFAVSRMREDPTISYRALAKVLDLSDQTVRRWRDEEGIQPRPHHNTGRRRNGAKPIEWFTPPVGVRESDDFESNEAEDDEEEYESDAAPPAGSHAANLAQTWETIGKMGGLFGFLNPPTPHRSTSPPASKAKRSTIPEDPGTRLRAISAELRARKPRGLHAVELLVEADEYVKPGTLGQYGEAMGCDPGDIATAKRVVVGRGRR